MKKEWFWWMLTHPFCLILYAVSWFHVWSVCKYGRLAKNLPVLAVCLALWLIWLVRLLLGLHRLRRNGTDVLYNRAETEGERIRLFREGENEERSFCLDEVAHYRKSGERVSVFLKGDHFIQIDCSGFDSDTLVLKLSALRFFRKHVWGVPVLALLCVITLAGAVKVAESARPYSGKLGWYIREIADTRWMDYERDNLYEDGLDGLLEAVETKVALPDTLAINAGFNLHFAPDGRICSVYAYLSGYAADGSCEGSYLITYDAARSERISVRLQSGGPAYDEEKDFGILVEALRTIPVKETVAAWQEEEYGILYLGRRQWKRTDTNIWYIDEEGCMEKASMENASMEEASRLPGADLSGYSISVFCPENDSIPPVRYLYVETKRLDPSPV